MKVFEEIKTTKKAVIIRKTGGFSPDEIQELTLKYPEVTITDIGSTAWGRKYKLTYEMPQLKDDKKGKGTLKTSGNYSDPSINYVVTEQDILEAEKEKEKFIKHDADKLRYELIPPEILESLAKVFSHGAKKYGDYNWKNCDDVNRMWGGIFRHIQAHRMGEQLDSDSGNFHLEHALASLSMVLWLEKDKK